MSMQHSFPAQLHRQINWKAAGLLVPGLLLFSAIPASAKHVEKHFKVEAHPVITIHNPNGTVTVKAWTKQEVMVLADHASTSIEVDVVQTGNRIDVMTRTLSNDVSPEDVRADFQINVPEDAELQIHDDSGAVSVNDVLGDMNVETVGRRCRPGRLRRLFDRQDRGRLFPVLALRRPDRSVFHQRKLPPD